MKHKRIKLLLMTGVLTLGLCTGCNTNKEYLTLKDQYTNSQKMVEQYKKDKEKLIEQNKELQKENKTLKKKTNNKTESKKETVTKSKTNNANNNNKNKHTVTTKNTTKNKDNKNRTTKRTNDEKIHVEGQDCDVCGEFVPMRDMCDCDGGIHHRGCKHKIYNCPQCRHTTTANPDDSNFSCGWCGYPDDDLRISYCRFCGKEVTRDNQYGECRDVCQSCAEKRYE